MCNFPNCFGAALQRPPRDRGTNRNIDFGRLPAADASVVDVLVLVGQNVGVSDDPQITQMNADFLVQDWIAAKATK